MGFKLKSMHASWCQSITALFVTGSHMNPSGTLKIELGLKLIALRVKTADQMPAESF